jgi:hypothetical protein
MEATTHCSQRAPCAIARSRHPSATPTSTVAVTAPPQHSHTTRPASPCDKGGARTQPHRADATLPHSAGAPPATGTRRPHSAVMQHVSHRARTAPAGHASATPQHAMRDGGHHNVPSRARPAARAAGSPPALGGPAAMPLPTGPVHLGNSPRRNGGGSTGIGPAPTTRSTACRSPASSRPASAASTASIMGPPLSSMRALTAATAPRLRFDPRALTSTSVGTKSSSDPLPLVSVSPSLSLSLSSAYRRSSRSRPRRGGDRGRFALVRGPPLPCDAPP